MDRLNIPELLQDTSRVVYLDTDTLVLSDLANLIQIDVSPTGIGARTCLNPPYVKFGTSWNEFMNDMPFPKDRFSADWDSLNSGVMFLDLARLRETHFTRRCLAPVEEFKINDQLAITAFSRGKFTHLDRSWNHFPSHEDPNVLDCKIIHWAGEEKPWNEEGNFSNFWFAERTDWNSLMKLF